MFCTVVIVTITRGLDTAVQLEALYDLAVELSAQRRPEAVLDVALRQCLELTESEFGFIGLVSKGSDVMDIAAIQGFHPAPAFYHEHRTIPLRPNVFARVVLEDRAVRTIDATLEPGRVGQPVGHPSVRAFLGVPLRVEGRAIGMIGVANRPAPYEPEHERLTLTHARFVALHLHNAQLFEAVQAANGRLERLVDERTRELATARDALLEKAARLKAVLADTVDTQEAERQRIARDLHDGVGQLLIGAMLELGSARQRLEAGQIDAADAALGQAGEIVSQVESELRRVVLDIHPPILEGLGLGAALRDVVDRFAAFSGLRCEVQVDGPPRRLPGRIEIGLYRVAQEALGNVAAHARASRVRVELRFVADTVHLTLTDDGAGFDVERAQSLSRHGHFGLESMRRRVESLGGAWSMASAPGSGTAVGATVEVP